MPSSFDRLSCPFHMLSNLSLIDMFGQCICAIVLSPHLPYFNFPCDHFVLYPQLVQLYVPDLAQSSSLRYAQCR